jgi:GT2 family glycosyltransferase
MNAFFNRFNFVGMSGGGDQSLFITKKTFQKLDGFDEKYCIMEDFEIVKRIKKSYKFKLIPKSMIVSARKYGDNNWLKIQMANFLVFAMFAAHSSPEKMKSVYKKLIH